MMERGSARGDIDISFRGSLDSMAHFVSTRSV